MTTKKDTRTVLNVTFLYINLDGESLKSEIYDKNWAFTS